MRSLRRLTKRKRWPVKEVLAEAFLDQAREAVEALAHVDRPGAEEDPDGRGERDHEVASWRREAGECGDEPSQPFRIGRGVEAEADVVGQLDLEAAAGRRVGLAVTRDRGGAGRTGAARGRREAIGR